MDIGTKAVVAHVLAEWYRRNLHAPMLPSPYTLEVCLTSICQALCTFCSYGQRNAANRSRPANSFEAIIGVLKGVENLTTAGVFLAGDGEPLISPHFQAVVEYARRFAEVSVQTNGLLMDQQIIKKGSSFLNMLDLVSISVCADTEEMYKRIVGIPRFDTLVESIKKLVALRDRSDRYIARTHINVKILINRVNFENVPRMYKFYKGLGVDSVQLRTVNNYEPGQDVELGDHELEILIDSLRRERDSQFMLQFASLLQNKRTSYSPIISSMI